MHVTFGEDHHILLCLTEHKLRSDFDDCAANGFSISNNFLGTMIFNH